MQAKQLVLNNLLVNYYYAAGEEEQPVLLFLHGWRSEGKVWQEIMEKLPEYNRYALDLPGFGSSQVPQTFTLQNYAEIIDEFIKKLNLKRVILIGHSFGGRVAIKLAAQAPAYLEKIVLVDSAGVRAGSAIKTLKMAIAKIAKPFFSLPFLNPVRRKIYFALGSEDYIATPQLRQTFLNIINEDLTQLLPKINQPALLVWGKNDKDTPLTQARIMEQKVPGSQLVILLGAGHFSFLDKQEEFVNELKKFI